MARQRRKGSCAPFSRSLQLTRKQLPDAPDEAGRRVNTFLAVVRAPCANLIRAVLVEAAAAEAVGVGISVRAHRTDRAGFVLVAHFALEGAGLTYFGAGEGS